MSELVKNGFFIAGIGCLGGGLAMNSISLALSVLGAIFLALWFVAFWFAAKKRG